VHPLQARCQIGQRAGNRRNGYSVAFLDLTATDRSGVEPQVGAVSTALLSGHRHVLHAVVVRYLKLVDPRRGLVAGAAPTTPELSSAVRASTSGVVSIRLGR